MKNLRIEYGILKYNLYILILLTFLTKSLFSNETIFEIKGNDFTDINVILSILKDIPDSPNKEYTNEIINALNASNLFSDVQVNLIDDKFLILVKEYPNIDQIYFNNNERLKDEELEFIASQLNFNKLNKFSINQFINELKKTYQSFGYNNIQIEYSKKNYEKNNTVDLYFNINEGELTKINKIILRSNNSIFWSRNTTTY